MEIDKQKAGVTEGRIVHYQVETAPGIVECRAAIIVQSWPNAAYTHGEVNLTVFTDRSNDIDIFGGKDPLVWKTSVPYHKPGERVATVCDPFGEHRYRSPGTWHFPQEG